MATNNERDTSDSKKIVVQGVGSRFAAVDF